MSTLSSLSTALNSAMSALKASQAGLSVASNNIANVNTPGYSRQRIMLQEAPTIGDTISVGTGVHILGTEAIRDQLIERRIWNETSGKSASDLTHQSLTDIENLFNEAGNTGLLPLISNFYNSFQKLSTNPSSPELRQQVISSATALTQSINSRANELRDMRTSIDRSIGEDVSKANILIGQIAEVSKQIHEAEATEPANDLRDQRTSLIKKLSEVMNVKELDSNGTYQLTTGNGRPLVIAGTAIPLAVGTSSGGLTTVLSGPHDITSEFSSGTLAARVALRDQTIPKYQQSLDQLAFDLATQVNQLHSVSYDQDGNTGTNFFNPIAAVPGAALSLQVNSVVAADPRKIAAASQPGGTDNEAAIALGNLVNATNPPRGTITDQYRGLVFQIGSETASVQVDFNQHESTLTQLENMRASLSGVSIDEETASILQFQRAYQASARVITTIDQLLQVTLAMGTAGA